MKSIRARHCWVQMFFKHVQNFRTDLPKLHGREEHCLNWLSLSLLEWPGMTRNGQEWSPKPTWIVNSSSFSIRFGTVRLGQKEPCSTEKKNHLTLRWRRMGVKIKIRHVRSQVDKVWLYLRMTTNECAK